MSKITINFILNLYIDFCILLNPLSDGIIFIHHESCWVYKIVGDASPLSNIVWEKRNMHVLRSYHHNI